MTLATIARPPSLVEKVCDQLAGIIRREQDEDDGWLPTERELSAQLGVSRSVVREAAKRLESQGLIEIQHGIGIKAVDKLHKALNGSLAMLIPDAEERLRQLNETRLAIEPESARLAAAATIGSRCSMAARMAAWCSMPVNFPTRPMVRWRLTRPRSASESKTSRKI